MMTVYVGCPKCRVKYPVEKLYNETHDGPGPGKVYTIVCAVCRHQFDVSFYRRWPLPLRVVVNQPPRHRDSENN
jgi:hypothetical protein